MDKYKKKIEEYEEKLKNYESFDYNAEADELFSLTRAQLEREERDGVSDVLARYAANTGMSGSSAAMTAAQQTASKYKNMVADALTEAEARAYTRWKSERADLESKIAAAREEAYSEAATRASLGDLSGYEGLGYDTSAYKAQLAAKAAQNERTEALEDAKLRASLGDFSGYRALGYDTSAYEAELASKAANEKRTEALEDAKLRASFGDFSGYRALGYDTSAYEAKLAAKVQADDDEKKLSEAKLRAQYGDYSMLRELGYDTSAYEAEKAREKEIDEANIKKNVIGANGMTREDFEKKISGYDADIAYYNTLGFYSYARSLETHKQRLISEYYNIGSTESASGGRVVSFTAAPEGEELSASEARALIAAYNNGKPISLEDYERLAWYYRDLGGKSYLYSLGIISEGIDGAYMM